MKKVRLPEHATISVSRDDWDSATTRGLGGWGWFLAIIIFLLIGWGSTDGENLPESNPSPTPSVTVVVP